MSVHVTTLPIRHADPVERSGVVIVCDGSEAPDWVVQWCRRSGRWLRRQHLPEAAPGDFPASAQRIETIAETAADAARQGVAVLAVVSEPGTAARSGPRRVVAAVQSLPDDAPVLAAAATAAQHMGAELVVAHGVPTSFGARSVGLDAALDRARSLLHRAEADVLDAVPGLTVEQRLLRVHPHEMVGEGLDADLLVVGASRTSPPGPLGLVACSALHHAPCSVLLTPRAPLPRHGS
ncbi:universal stress protein [Pseudonocardia xinjiangensis]|uniref:universal stress protein n=1 Tax=Pseudonocardia xinjiangensis TaxID=75289 RepID=UPI00146DFAC3